MALAFERGARLGTYAASALAFLAGACTLDHKPGFYSCPPDGGEPRCPSGWHCRADQLCWPTPDDDAGVEADDGACAPVEECNGRDDDCDTVCDEGFPCCAGTSTACTTACGTLGTGECAATTCRLPDPAECTPPVEACNGHDDDCDTATDEDFACSAGDPTTCTTTCGSIGVGTCTETCAAPAPEECTPPADQCDGADEDCDGVCDDGFDCCGGRSTACTTTCGSTGTGTCSATCGVPGPGDCELPAELCNGVDDDCDGATDEEAWCPVADVPTAADLWAIWGVAADDIWVVGDAGTILRWDGAGWSALDGVTTQPLRGVWAASATDVWVVGPVDTILHWDGAGWLDESTGAGWELYDVWGASADEVWAVGGSGTAVRRSGGVWAERSPTSMNRLYGVGGGAANAVAAIGQGGTVRWWDGGSWSIWYSGFTTFYAVGGTASNDLWAVGAGGMIRRRTGMDRFEDVVPTGSGADLYAVWGVTPTDAWAVGAGGTILHWDGWTWSAVDSEVTVDLRGVWAAPTGELWAVGPAGLILYRRPR